MLPLLCHGPIILQKDHSCDVNLEPSPTLASFCARHVCRKDSQPSSSEMAGFRVRGLYYIGIKGLY